MALALSTSRLVHAAPTKAAAVPTSGADSQSEVLLVSNYTDLQASLRQYKQLAGSSGLVLAVSKDIALGAPLEVRGSQSVIIQGGTTPTGRPPVLSCRPGSTAFNLLGGGQLTLVGITFAGCDGAPILHATGAGSRLALDGVTVTDSISSQAGSALVHMEGGARLSINNTRFFKNGGIEMRVPLVRVEQAAGGLFEMHNTSFTDNVGDQLLVIRNTARVVYTNASLVAIATGFDHGWDPAGQAALVRSMAQATISSTVFSGNTVTNITGRPELLRSDGAAVAFVGCTWANNTSFGKLVSLSRGAAEFKSCRFTNNTGTSSGAPSLLSIVQGVGLTSLENCTISGNNGTGGIFHTGFSHWIYRNTSTSKVPWSNSTKQGTRYEGDWSVTDLNRTLQGTYYNSSRFNELWPDNTTTFKQRWVKIARLNHIINYERSHHSPLLVRRCVFSGNTFVWGGVLNLNSNAESATSMFLDDVQFDSNVVVDPPGFNATAFYLPPVVNGTNFYQPPAIISAYAAMLRLRKLSVTFNRARHIMHLQRVVVNTTNSSLLNNSALEKVFYAANSSMSQLTFVTLVNNTGAGVLDLQVTDITTLHRLTIHGNTASSNVASFAQVNVLTMNHTVLRENAAEAGTIFRINYSVYGVWTFATFQRNSAGSSVLCIVQPFNLLDAMKMGDAVFADNTVELVNSPQDSDEGNQGGALVINGNIDSSQYLNMVFTDMNFTNNKVVSNGSGTPAGHGGGLRAAGVLGSVQLTNAKFSGNSAADGGAMHLNCQAVISNANFTKNIASGKGGAIAAVNWTALIVKDSNFSLNSASVGGALLVAPATSPPEAQYNIAVTTYSSFTGSTFTFNNATAPKSQGGAVAVAVGQEPCLPGGGGAMCLSPKSIQRFNITGSTISNNTADWGGAVFVDDISVKDLKPGVDTAVVYMCGNQLAGNKAAANGGHNAYYTLNTSAAAIECMPRAKCTRGPLNVSGTYGDPSCPPSGTTAKPGVATGGVTVEFIAGILNETDITIRSGASINATLQFRDAFGDVLTTLPPYNITIDVDSYDKKRLVVFGALNGTANVTSDATGKRDGTANFSAIFLQPNLYAPDNSWYTLNINVTGSRPISKPVNITIRNCNIGERLTDTFSCLPCGNNTFSNDPIMGSCAPCPTGGNCSIGALLPKKNFWQSTPQSPQVHRCPLSGSCVGSATDLGAFMTNDVSPALFQLWRSRKDGGANTSHWRDNLSDVSRKYTQRQCARGHKGNLCGVCKGPEYGRFGFSCIRCLPRKLNNFLIFMSVLVLAVILTCTVFSHLRGTAQRAAAVRFLPLRGGGGPMQPPLEELPAAASGRRRSLAAEVPAAAHDSVQSFSRPNLGTAPATSEPSGASQLRQRGKAGGGPAPLDTDMDRDQDMMEPTLSHSPGVAPLPFRSSMRRGGTKAKEFLTVAKIFVSYVQVVGIMRTLQLDWPPYLQRIVNSVDISSSANYISMECSLGHMDSLKKAVFQTSSIVVLPVLAMLGAAVFWLVYGLIHKRILGRPLGWSGETPLQYFWHRLVLTTVQICYYLYPVVSMAIFQIFTWTTIDDKSDDDIGRQYYNHDNAYLLVGRFWTQHFDTKYFEGTHRTLALALGVPGLLLFALGFPLVSALQLWWNRNRLDDPEVVLVYGFLYEEYEDQYYAWETVIMLRKAALLACAVFLRPFGVAVQLLSPNIILAACIYAQGNYEPFQEARMNALESLSLFTTQVTLLGFGFFLPVVQTAHAFKLVLTILLVTMNGLVVLYFLFHLLRVARALLVSVNISFDGVFDCLHRGGDQPCCGCWSKMEDGRQGEETKAPRGLEARQP